jgi:hypothetical protein
MGQDVFAVGNFTVTPSFTGSPTNVLFTLTDTAGLLTTSKMVRAVLGDAIDQWITTNLAQLATNSVTIGNNSVTDDFGGSNPDRPAGDGFLNINWDFSDKTGQTPSIVTTSLTTTAITVSKPYADVV